MMNLNISYINFTHLSLPEKLKVLEWRNRSCIREKMANASIISEEEHLNFCDSLLCRQDLKMFQVRCNGEGVGVISLKHIDLIKKSAEVGNYYIKSGIIPSKCAFYADHLFSKLGLSELTCYVKKNNLKALMFNLVKLHGIYQHEDDKYVYIKFLVSPQPIKAGVSLEINL